MLTRSVASGIALLLFSSTLSAELIGGEIFIRTKGGETIKLSAVHVGLFKTEDLADHLERKNAEAKPHLERLRAVEKEKKDISDAARDEWVRAPYTSYEQNSRLQKRSRAASDDYISVLKQSGYWGSGYFRFLGLPPAVQTTLTDSEGRFVFEIPDEGEFTLAACANRMVGGEMESYYWVEIVRREPGKILLSNHNVADTVSDSFAKEGLAHIESEKRTKAMHAQRQLEAEKLHREERKIAEEQSAFAKKIARGVLLKQPFTIATNYGEVIIPKGTRLQIEAVAEDKIKVRYATFTADVPIASTDWQ